MNIQDRREYELGYLGLLFFIICICFIGCGDGFYKVIESRSRLDALPATISDEEFVHKLVIEYEKSKVHLSSFRTNRFGFASCNGRAVTFNLSLWSGGELGSTARSESAWAISLLLWLASSRMEAIEKINIFWKATDDNENTVNFNATFTPKYSIKKLNKLIYTEKRLYSHQEDSLDRLRDYIKKISYHQFNVTLNTASGKIMKAVRKY